MRLVRGCNCFCWSIPVVAVLLGFAPLSAAEVGEAREEPRTWTSADGKFQTQARLAEAGKDSVVLEKGDGTRVTVPRSVLSPGDLDYVRRHPVPAAKTAAAAAADPRKPLLDREFRKQIAEFVARTMKESYAKGGKTSTAWDADVQRLFDSEAARAAYNVRDPVWTAPQYMGAREVHAAAAAIRQAGCDDPCITSLYVRIMPNVPWDEQTVRTALAALGEMQRRGCHPVQVADLAQAIVVLGRGQGRDVPVRALAESVIAMARQKEYPGLTRRFLFARAHQALSRVPGIHKTVYTELLEGKDLDPWITAMLLGNRESTWARAAEEMSAARRRPQIDEPPAHWAAARDYYLRAWKAHPEHPEPALELMRVAAATEGIVEGTARTWFDRAVAVHLDFDPPYKVMRQQLMEAGDVDKMHAFGLECLQTGRYDSEVPAQYLLVLADLQILTRSLDWWRRKEVQDNLREFFRKSAENPQGRDMDYLTSQMAYCFYRSGLLPEALAAFDRVGERLDRGCFRRDDLDAETARAECRAAAGPLAAEIAAAGEAEADGHPEKAVEVLRRLMARLDKTDKSWRYVHHRLAAAEIEAAFAGGKWVPIQPPADLAGWTAARGSWSVDAQGTLVGKSSVDHRGQESQMILLCDACIGTRFELRGHAELVEQPEPVGGFGALIAYADSSRYWDCYCYPPQRHMAGAAHVRCSIHHNPHARSASPGRSDDFRVQVYEDRVVTTVGEETRAKEGPLAIVLDHDPPSSSTRFGVGGVLRFVDSTHLTVRFTNLELRKLTEPPAAKKVLEPESAPIDR
jgi:tetratricopeptide (TPR) repeat protein